MALSDIYRKQHDEILQMAGKLADLLDSQNLDNNARDVISLLAQFAAKLNIHLSMEDRALYPRLMNSDNPKCAQTAQEFQNEMGGIKQVFEKYMQDWSTSRNIQNNPDEFIKQSQGLIDALAKRIEKENQNLYPLADAL